MKSQHSSGVQRACSFCPSSGNCLYRIKLAPYRFAKSKLATARKKRNSASARLATSSVKFSRCFSNPSKARQQVNCQECLLFQLSKRLLAEVIGVEPNTNKLVLAAGLLAFKRSAHASSVIE